MTKEDILKMEAGWEMRLAIGERVFGWSWVDVPKDAKGLNAGKVLVSPALLELINRGMYQWQPLGAYRQDAFCHFWDTDIAAAWEVVEKMRVSLCAEIYEVPPGIWKADFAADQAIFGEAEAETAPLAICRAALIAMMESQ